MQADEFDSDVFWLAYGDYHGRRAVKPFVRYFVARHNERLNRRMFEIYAADSLNLIPQQKCISQSYSEIYKRVTGAAKEEKPFDEVVTDLMTRHNLKFKQKAGE